MCAQLCAQVYYGEAEGAADQDTRNVDLEDAATTPAAAAAQARVEAYVYLCLYIYIYTYMYIHT